MRYLMAFWGRFFQKSLNASLGDFEVCQFLERVFVYGPSYSRRDGNEGVGFTSIILYGFN
jgi:hypothetical protein